ncbi:hypothetical protein SKAU_G00051050 [Synaphobranchus kaupii]|uniref:Uncharacterized protein n=1 Tax=Synaphobranchus kaupii TaxID=118154 RepID=A0A9Q1G4E9_SYNKA|nr:hypothetical protein SKAU_G00051050 [Synaphobranchus kaupii]
MVSRMKTRQQKKVRFENAKQNSQIDWTQICFYLEDMGPNDGRLGYGRRSGTGPLYRLEAVSGLCALHQWQVQE